MEFSNLSFYFRSYGDLTPDEMDRVCKFLYGREVAQESTKLYQLKACFKAFRRSAPTYTTPVFRTHTNTRLLSNSIIATNVTVEENPGYQSFMAL